MSSLTISRLLRNDFEVKLMRWALVLIFVLFGYVKWFPYQAQALIPLLENSPILGWMHPVFGIQGASYALGTAELLIGLGLIIGAWLPKVSVIASLGSVVTYLTTITLIFSTPSAWEAFPPWAVIPGFC